MRPPVDEARVRELARRLGHIARGPTRIYLTGTGVSCARGWRASTVDIDMRFEPDADELLRELPSLKEQMGVNIELASPPDFIPELPGWRRRSPLVLQEGNVASIWSSPHGCASCMRRSSRICIATRRSIRGRSVRRSTLRWSRAFTANSQPLNSRNRRLLIPFGRRFATRRPAAGRRPGGRIGGAPIMQRSGLRGARRATPTRLPVVLVVARRRPYGFRISRAELATVSTLGTPSPRRDQVFLCSTSTHRYRTCPLQDHCTG